MRRIATLLYNVIGQSLSIRVPDAQPTSVTFAVYRNYSNDEATAEFSGTATVSSVLALTSAAAGPAQSDPQLLTLSTANIIAGNRYLLEQNSLKEWVVPIEVGASTIRVRFPLQRDFATLATLKGTYATAAVDATWIANIAHLSDLEDPTPDWRVKWTIATIGADPTTRVIYTSFDVVRSDTRPSVEIDDVNERAFGLVDSLPIEYRSELGRPLIDGAYKALRAHFFAQGISPESWRDEEALDELVVLRALRHLGEGGWHPVGTDLADWSTKMTKNYDDFFTTHVIGAKHKTSVDLETTTPRQPATAPEIWSK